MLPTACGVKDRNLECGLHFIYILITIIAIRILPGRICDEICHSHYKHAGIDDNNLYCRNLLFRASTYLKDLEGVSEKSKKNYR